MLCGDDYGSAEYGSPRKGKDVPVTESGSLDQSRDTETGGCNRKTAESAGTGSRTVCVVLGKYGYTEWTCAGGR